MRIFLLCMFIGAMLSVAVPTALAQTVRERVLERQRDERAQAVTLPAPVGMRVLRDVAYGRDPRQRFDVYLPATAHHAPVIFMVHGGGWFTGDKSNPGVIDNKIAYWLPRGYAVVSVNNRLVPDAAPLEQARDVARALVKAQSLADSWGADRERFVLMGHSAGAHLVALLDSNPALATEFGATLPRGTIALDSAAMDVVNVMQMPPDSTQLRAIYERAFGGDRRDWIAASPFEQLRAGAPPMLIVCSSRRVDSCREGRRLAEKAATVGVRMQVLPEDLSHAQINHALGRPSPYTEAVAEFVRSLLH